MVMTAIDERSVALAARALDALRERGLTLAVAESLTGGELAATLVSVPGASDVFRGGVVSYAVDIKSGVLGVSEQLLRDHGAVYPQVASQMAGGVRRLLRSDVALSTTGVAGPGPSEGHPAGTVFVGFAGFVAPGESAARELALAGDRSAIRAATVERALMLLLEELTQTIGHRP